MSCEESGTRRRPENPEAAIRSFAKGMRSQLDESPATGATIARSIPKERRMSKAAREQKIEVAWHDASSGDGRRAARAQAMVLLVLAEQGEERIELERERNELHRRSVEGSEQASARADARSRQMIEAAIGRAVDGDEGHRNVIDPDDEERDGAYERGYFRGMNEERDRWNGSVTKELIDAALAVGEEFTEGHGGLSTGHEGVDRLIRAGGAYRALMERDVRETPAARTSTRTSSASDQ